MAKSPSAAVSALRNTHILRETPPRATSCAMKIDTDAHTSNGDPAGVVVAALYKFVPVSDCHAVREQLIALCEREAIRGTLLVAPEGLNGTVAGSRPAIDCLAAAVRAITGSDDIEWKESSAPAQPFKRMKVRLKREIVTMGVEGIDPRSTVGTYVEPADWNNLISDPDTIVIDTRNDYEVAIGTFSRAINPKTNTFREFPAWVRENLDPASKPKVAMFCTGGIRCEKATALLKLHGFEEVYHLKGGILKYLEEVPAEQSLWQGECFVFDERVALGHELAIGSYQLCSVCRQPIPSETGHGGGYATRECAKCAAEADPERLRRAAERQRQIELAKARGENHFKPAPASPSIPDNT